MIDQQVIQNTKIYHTMQLEKLYKWYRTINFIGEFCFFSTRAKLWTIKIARSRNGIIRLFEAIFVFSNIT